MVNIALAEGGNDEAKRHFFEGLALSHEFGEETNIAYYLEGLAAPDRAGADFGSPF